MGIKLWKNHTLHLYPLKYHTWWFILGKVSHPYISTGEISHILIYPRWLVLTKNRHNSSLWYLNITHGYWPLEISHTTFILIEISHLTVYSWYSVTPVNNNLWNITHSNISQVSHTWILSEISHLTVHGWYSVTPININWWNTTHSDISQFAHTWVLSLGNITHCAMSG